MPKVASAPDAWRFKDEWLVAALSSLPAVGPVKIAELRVEKVPLICESIISKGLVGPAEIAQCVRSRFNIDTELSLPAAIDRLTLSLVPEKYCREHSVVPLLATEGFVDVAMANPLDSAAISDVESLTGRTARPKFAFPGTLSVCLEKIFNQDKLIFDLLEKIGPAEEVEVVGHSAAVEVGEDVRTPVIRLVNSILVQAVHKKASDIHIEHEELTSHVRYRVDGELQAGWSLPRTLASGAVVARIKIMANLDVTNHMRPQDGRAKLKIGVIEIGLRVSTLPTAFGEKVVLRILDKRAAEVPFEKLGFTPEVVRGLEACMQSPQGIILVTGPTGSGKTTSLYSMLSKRRGVSTNIVTIEDPIEYKLEGINQVQVNEKQGLNFPGVLRSVLRQDPDVIMIGEIRDKETADIAFQAAMTGHLVFSTLHTTDTLSTLSRLLDMGVERYKIAPGLLAITAQRLLRRLCPACRQEFPAGQMSDPLAGAMEAAGLPARLWKPVGCTTCAGSGYMGRISIIELLTFTQELKDLINSGASEADIRASALSTGNLRTMMRDLLGHLTDGDVDLAEATPYLSLQPLKTKEPSAIPIAAATPAASAPKPGKLTVMIVDDDDVMRLLARTGLRDQGYEFVEASDGAEALEQLTKTKPDLLLLDLKMPRLGGMEVIRGVRDGLGMRDLPIVVLTAEKDDVSQELALTLGADDYIPKPFKAGIVSARINAALRRAGKLAWRDPS